VRRFDSELYCQEGDHDRQKCWISSESVG
jgi:hypothetical protein